MKTSTRIQTLTSTQLS